VIADDLRQVLTPMDIADLEDYFLAVHEDADLDGPVEITLAEEVADDDSKDVSH
jgi:hypothetical protein